MHGPMSWTGEPHGGAPRAHRVQLEELLEAGQRALLVQQRQEHLQLQPVRLLRSRWFRRLGLRCGDVMPRRNQQPAGDETAVANAAVG